MVSENIVRIREHIRSVCVKARRNPDSITIVAVSKGRDLEQIKQAVEAGITDIGENRIQEAVVKYNDRPQATGHRRIKWHMVGHLQTNKAKDAVKIFDLIQSVDSLHIAAEINKQAARINKIQDILIEIKTSPEAAKFGISPENVPSLIKEISSLKNVSIKGLMTVASIVDNPEKARPYFMILREIRDKIRDTGYGLPVLSMGMTDDFQIAIEEGSTMVRLGRAIFD